MDRRAHQRNRTHLSRMWPWVELLIVFPAVGLAAQVPANPRPPQPYIVKNVCPGEGCSFGPWVACSLLTARAAPRDDATPRFTLRPGDSVTALTGDVRVDTAGVVIVRRRFTYVDPDDAGGRRTLLTPRDTLFLLAYLGEGSWTWWLRGRAGGGQEFWTSARWARDADSAVAVRDPTTRWWVRVRAPTGAEGWVVADWRRFEGMAPHYEDAPGRCSRE